MSESHSPEQLRDLYRELILDHAKSPRNFGKLEGMTHSAEGINPLCGDKLTVYLTLEDEDRVTDVAFQGAGCAISTASASMMTDALTSERPRELLEQAATAQEVSRAIESVSHVTEETAAG